MEDYPYSPKRVLVVGAILTVLFPILAGCAMQAKLFDVAFGLWVSAGVSGVIALLAHLERPHKPGAFQMVDIQTQERQLLRDLALQRSLRGIPPVSRLVAAEG